MLAIGFLRRYYTRQRQIKNVRAMYTVASTSEAEQGPLWTFDSDDGDEDEVVFEQRSLNK
jgi:hypothetical protein